MQFSIFLYTYMQIRRSIFKLWTVNYAYIYIYISSVMLAGEPKLAEKLDYYYAPARELNVELSVRFSI